MRIVLASAASSFYKFHTLQLDNSLMIPRHVLVGYALPHKPAQFAKLKVSATDYKSVTHEKMNFVVCVKPLPHGYGDAKMIFEYIQVSDSFEILFMTIRTHFKEFFVYNKSKGYGRII